MRIHPSAHASSFVVLLVAFGLGAGCAGISRMAAPGRMAYDYFTRPAPNDAWTPKIAGWQARESAEEEEIIPSSGNPFADVAEAPGAADGRGDVASSEPVAALGGRVSDLRTRYFRFREDRKRRTARAFVEWIQAQAAEYYVADGPIDHWATLEETLRSDGDDCDGLELLAFHGLRDLGFDPHEVYRAVVYRRTDDQHHMVTLWFEDPTDPWVLDPTGAMVRGMSRMSELPDWVPLKVFSESAEYTVRSRDEGGPSDSAIASNR